MKYYSYKDAPLKVFGLVDFEKNQKLQRLPDEIIDQLENKAMNWLGHRIPGSRIGFRTNSKEIKVTLTFSSLNPDMGVSATGCQAVYCFIGSKSEGKYQGHCRPNTYDQKTIERVWTKSNEMEDVLLWLPRNEPVADITIGFDDDAIVEAPTPYKYAKPVLFYGSSITEGGCATVFFNSYNCMLSRWLDMDFYNLGFSGSARGEKIIAEYIANVDMSVFVYDYDHNAPTPEYLQETHEAFFKIIREKNPTLPVLMLTRPCVDRDEDNQKRREIVYQTYLNAKAAGDDRVWFIDGYSYYGDTDRELCTMDLCHPNDLGFHRMGKVIEPVLKEILEKYY